MNCCNDSPASDLRRFYVYVDWKDTATILQLIWRKVNINLWWKDTKIFSHADVSTIDREASKGEKAAATSMLTHLNYVL